MRVPIFILVKEGACKRHPTYLGFKAPVRTTKYPKGCSVCRKHYQAAQRARAQMNAPKVQL